MKRSQFQFYLDVGRPVFADCTKDAHGMVVVKGTMELMHLSDLVIDDKGRVIKNRWGATYNG